jgi:hypothetical protein
MPPHCAVALKVAWVSQYFMSITQLATTTPAMIVRNCGRCGWGASIAIEQQAATDDGRLARKGDPDLAPDGLARRWALHCRNRVAQQAPSVLEIVLTFMFPGGAAALFVQAKRQPASLPTGSVAATRWFTRNERPPGRHWQRS